MLRLDNGWILFILYFIYRTNDDTDNASKSIKIVPTFYETFSILIINADGVLSDSDKKNCFVSERN